MTDSRRLSPMLNRLLTFTLFVTALLAPLHTRAESFTLTDKQGRSITADVLSVNGDKVKIKRDDGQTFELALATLSEADQKKLKKWAEVEATRIPADALKIELSRGVFDTKKTEDMATYTTKELWGYNITVANQSGKPLGELKIKYVLFVKPDLEPGKDSSAASFKRTAGSATITGIQPLSKTALRTDTIDIYKQRLKPGWVWGKTGNTEMIRDTLHGIWLKVYSGNQLVAEICTPEALIKTEKAP